LSGAEGGVFIFGADLFAIDADGVAEKAADLVGGGAPDFLTAAIEFGLEEMVVEPPAGDGDAVDFEVVSDGGVGLASDQQFDGILLACRERSELGSKSLQIAAIGERGGRVARGTAPSC
jgi:hypothetical protein